MTKQNYLFTNIKNEEEYAKESYEDALKFKCKICGEKHDWEEMYILKGDIFICKKHRR